MSSKLSLSWAISFLLFAICAVDVTAQVASRTDGGGVVYYDSLHEAFAAAVGVSIDNPDEITLLADLVLDAPLIVGDGVHIRLVAGGSDRTIRRSVNNIDYPVIWVNGDSASLSLGKPGMEYELIIDGGRLNSPPIEAHAPLVAVGMPDSKLVMYDKVTVQNNINNGVVPTNTNYQNGAGVYVRTQGNVQGREAEFIMKGGTIRGNMCDTQNVIASGGGVMIHAFGIFTMEGGAIMNNTAHYSGGGVWIYSTGSFNKTGGIIYGANAPAGHRNTVIEGIGTPRSYGYAVAVIATVETLVGYRNDTVAENDSLSFLSDTPGNGILGKGEKWDTPSKAFLRMLLAIFLPLLALVVCAFLLFRNRTLKLAKLIQEAADQSVKAAPEIDLENIDLSDREVEICELLLTDRPLKQIAAVLKLSYPGATHRAQNLYKKLGIENRTELLVRVRPQN